MISSKKYFITLVAMAALSGLAGCGDDDEGVMLLPASGPKFLAGGGNSEYGIGGAGGELYIESRGSASVLRSGTVDASFEYTAPTPAFGANHVVVDADITVQVDADAAVDGPLCTLSDGFGNLYEGDGSGTCGDAGDVLVTGITINSGATLTLVENDDDIDFPDYALLFLSNDLVINGTLTLDVNGTDTTLNEMLIAVNYIEVARGGRITGNATADAGARNLFIYAGDGSVGAIVNRGTIEAKGMGTGIDRYVELFSDNAVVNYGTIDTSGGDSGAGSGGDAGDLYIDVEYGGFYSSGPVRLSGGEGATDGGDAGGAYIYTAAMDNNNGDNGDIVISGTWEALGGRGNNGAGGIGGYLYFRTYAMGAVTVNAKMSVKGGDGLGGSGAGGGTYGIYIFSDKTGTVDVPAPGNVRVTGTFDARGGSGGLSGGNGGWLRAFSSMGNNATVTAADIEFILASATMNGGNGRETGGSANGSAFRIATWSPGGAAAAGPITNQAGISAKGGNSTDTIMGTGGAGGYVDLWTDPTNADAATVITNSGNIDISAGQGHTAGDADDLYFTANQVTNSGNITMKGGNGIGAGSMGGDGGRVEILSRDWNTGTPTPTVNTGALTVTGGAGTTAGLDGTITIDTTVVFP